MHYKWPAIWAVKTESARLEQAGTEASTTAITYIIELLCVLHTHNVNTVILDYNQM